MEIVAATDQWLFTDAERLQNFLLANPRFMTELAARTPFLKTGEDKGDNIHSILIRSGEVRGFQIMLQAILSMANPAPISDLNQPATQVSSNYPPPEDDKAWADGKKLNDPNATLE